MNKQYWDDLVFEGEKLTEAAEGAARDLSENIADTDAGRAATRTDAEKYRKLVNDNRYRDPKRPEHQLQDVLDAYRWNHRDAAEAVRHHIGFSRPGR